MADGSAIEWTEATWNIITGCSVVSPGCTNCYAMKLAGTRLRNDPSRQGLTIDTKAGPVWNGEVRFNKKWLDLPLHWERPRKIFICAHGDLFHEAVPDEWLDQIFAVMALCPQHIFQVLTKRPERMREYVARRRSSGEIARVIVDRFIEGSIKHREPWPVRSIGNIDDPEDIVVAWPLPNVWLGVSAEDQSRANERIPILLDTPAAIRWVSAEPLLGPIEFDDFCDGYKFVDWLRGNWWHDTPEPYASTISRGHPKLDWIVVGGESGPNARPMHPQWARSIRDQCKAAGVPFFFKQWGAWMPTSGIDTYSFGPTKSKRQFPNASGISWLKDGRIMLRDFSVGEHAARIRAGKAIDTRAVEVDQTAWEDWRRASRRADEIGSPAPLQALGLQWMYCVGKDAAGRLLDGVEHNGFPQVRP